MDQRVPAAYCQALLDLDAINQELARRDFWEYFRWMGPDLLQGWWQQDAANHLSRWYQDLMAGRRPLLLLAAPPQHGKSRLLVDFIAWLVGKDPDRRVIYASYSDTLGVRANLRLQRTIDSPRYQEVFPGTTISASNVVTQAGKPRRNSELIEFIGHEGFFRNTTIRGQITGQSLDVGILDDPFKGREEAESKTIREKTWDWFTDDFSTRCSKDAGLVLIMTRWHLDDLAGRLLASQPGIHAVEYRAIAERDEPPHRVEGEALFPELKPLDFLLDQKSTMLPASWLALYQQRPVPRGGSIVKEAWLAHRYRSHGAKPLGLIQSWDCASKPGERNDPSACVTLAGYQDRVEVWDVDVGRREFPDLVRRAKDQAERF